DQEQRAVLSGARRRRSLAPDARQIAKHERPRLDRLARLPGDRAVELDLSSADHRDRRGGSAVLQPDLARPQAPHAELLDELASILVRDLPERTHGRARERLEAIPAGPGARLIGRVRREDLIELG